MFENVGGEGDRWLERTNPDTLYPDTHRWFYPKIDSSTPTC